MRCQVVSVSQSLRAPKGIAGHSILSRRKCIPKKVAGNVSLSFCTFLPEAVCAVAQVRRVNEIRMKVPATGFNLPLTFAETACKILEKFDEISLQPAPQSTSTPPDKAMRPGTTSDRKISERNKDSAGTTLRYEMKGENSRWISAYERHASNSAHP